jgi:hypothetical protein
MFSPLQPVAPMVVVADALLRAHGWRLHRPIFFGFGQARLVLLVIVLVLVLVVSLRNRRNR